MSLFSTTGKEVRGLLSGDQFFDNMARAQAFAHGDYEAAHRIGAEIRRRRDEKAAAATPAAPLVPEQPGEGTEARDLPYPSLPGKSPTSPGRGSIFRRHRSASVPGRLQAEISKLGGISGTGTPDSAAFSQAAADRTGTTDRKVHDDTR